MASASFTFSESSLWSRKASLVGPAAEGAQDATLSASCSSSAEMTVAAAQSKIFAPVFSAVHSTSRRSSPWSRAENEGPVDAKRFGPLYSAIWANCRRTCAASEAVRAILAQAEDEHSVYSGGDGTHLSPAGVEAAAPCIRELLVQTGAHLIVSDSTLCSVESGWRDKSGRVANAAIGDVPVRPWWGASFLSSYSSFAQAISWAHEDCGGTAEVILLFVAGNDIDPRSDPRSLDLEMRRILAEWSARGVDVLFIDVVPPSFHSQ